MTLKPLNLLPARERVASSLRKAIISRDFVEGEQITLDAIASILGVSKTPVREAFLMLENEGLIKLMPNKRVVVLGMTEKNVREHFQVRAALESEAAVFCCEEHVDLTAIREIIEDSRCVIASGNFEEYSNLNQAFHVAIWTSCGNDRLKNMLSVMWNGLSIRYMESLEDYAVKSFAEHEEIYAALEARDAARTSALMRAHIFRSMNDMLTNLHEEKSHQHEE